MANFLHSVDNPLDLNFTQEISWDDREFSLGHTIITTIDLEAIKKPQLESRGYLDTLEAVEFVVKLSPKNRKFVLEKNDYYPLSSYTQQQNVCLISRVLG